MRLFAILAVAMGMLVAAAVALANPVSAPPGPANPIPAPPAPRPAIHNGWFSLQPIPSFPRQATPVTEQPVRAYHVGQRCSLRLETRYRRAGYVCVHGHLRRLQYRR